MAACNMMHTTTANRVPAALLLLLLLPAAMPVSLASPAITGVQLREVASVAGVMVKKVVSSSKAPGAAISGGFQPLPASLASRRTLAARKLIPPSGPSEGSNSYRFHPPPA
ncbi:unnamed protein product [Urochloa humidicola]